MQFRKDVSTIVLELHARIRSEKKIHVFVKIHVTFRLLLAKISAVDDRLFIFRIFKGRIFLKRNISEPKSGHIICPKAAEYIDRYFFHMNVANQEVCPLTYSIVRVLYLHIVLGSKSQSLHISL